MPQTVRLDAAEVAAAVEENGKVDLEDQTRAVPRPGAAPGGIKLPGVPAAKPATVPTASAILSLSPHQPPHDAAVGGVASDPDGACWTACQHRPGIWSD